MAFSVDSMFYEAVNFNQPINKWNVSNVNAESFNQPLHAPWYVVEESESE